MTAYLLFVCICLFFHLAPVHLDSLHSNPENIFIVVEKELNMTIKCSETLDLELKYDKNNLAIENLMNITALQLANDETEFVYNIKVLSEGTGYIIVMPENGSSKLPEDLKIRYDIYKSHTLLLLSQAIRWICAIGWVLSFVPQFRLNMKQSSVHGLDFNFLLLSLAEYFYFIIFSISLLRSSVKYEILSETLIGNNWIYMSDVIHASLGFFMLCLIALQCLFYETTNQHLFIGTNLIVFLCMIGATISLSEQPLIISMKLFMCYKTFFSVIKYLPQVCLNMRSMSTEGWSILLVVFDLTANLLKVIFYIFDSDNFNTWQYLASLSFIGAITLIMFDFIFVGQHVIYKPKNRNVNKRSPSVQTLSSIV